MRVAILYNPRPECDSGALDDAFEEYDEPETIAAITKALAGMGVEPTPVTADAEFPWRLKHGGFDFVFNIPEGARRRCREAVPAAICEFPGVPVTGSDALTLATTLDKAVARRIVSPEVPVARAVLVECPVDEDTLAGLSYPVVVKPNDEGSSKGIRRKLHHLLQDAGSCGVRLTMLNLESARFECTFGRGCEGVCCRKGRPPVYPEEARRIDEHLHRILPLLRPEARGMVDKGGYVSRV